MVVLTSFTEPTDGIRHRQQNTTVYVNDNNLGKGTLYIAESRLSWLGEAGNGFSIEYPHISLHAISRDLSAFPQECLFLMLDTPLGDEYCNGEEEDDDANDSNREETTEMRLVPDDRGMLDAMFHAMNTCQTLHPDPEDSFSDEDFFEDADNEIPLEEADSQMARLRIGNMDGRLCMVEGLGGDMVGDSTALGILGGRAGGNMALGTLGGRAADSMALGILEGRAGGNMALGILGGRAGGNMALGTLGGRAADSMASGILGGRAGGRAGGNMVLDISGDREEGRGVDREVNRGVDREVSRGVDREEDTEEDTEEDMEADTRSHIAQGDRSFFVDSTAHPDRSAGLLLAHPPQMVLDLHFDDAEN